MSTAALTHYRLLGLVGQGQFAQVYCAIHRATGQMVAIKKTRHAREKISPESVVLPKLKHPNIVECYAVEPSDRSTCLILEYCESGTLRHYIEALHTLPFNQSQSILIEILSALAHIHKKEIIHGDLKPENILLTHGLNALSAKVSDFGSACSVSALSQSSREIGSPSYAAPERFAGQASYATDLYSVGVMMYEMFLGDRPFSGTPQELSFAHRHKGIHLPANISTPAAQLLRTALHKNPEKRFVNARAMMEAIQQLSAVRHSAARSVDVHPDNKTQRVALSLEQMLTPTDRPYSFEGTASGNMDSGDMDSGNIASENIASENIASSPKGCGTQAIALTLNSRYNLHISTSQADSQTVLKGFTRHGQCIGQYTLNFALNYVALTQDPYQLIACRKVAAAEQPTAIIITLKPLQIRYLPCTSPAHCACTTPWGYVVVCQNNVLFFDRTHSLLKKVRHSLKISQIAALSPSQLILATPKTKTSSLQHLDLEQLELDIIF